MVYGAYGYGINTKTGDIIQNGLVFVGSKPSGANVSINGQPQGSKTSARLVLPAGDYNLTLSKSGYYNWQRKFTLTEHSIARYVYPFLFPQKPKVSTIKTYSSSPSLVTQSLDRRWLLVQVPSTSSVGVVFDQFDTNSPNQLPRQLVMPPTVVANSGGSFKEVEWSSDNKHVLLLHRFGKSTEYIIFNRDLPAESINVNKLIKQSLTDVKLLNKQVNQVYVLSKTGGVLSVADLSNGKISPILRHILAYKPSGKNIIGYVTDQAPAGQAKAEIYDGSKSYSLYQFGRGTNYLIDEARFQGHWYYVAGSDSDPRVNIYKDPLDSLKNSTITRAIPLLSMNIKGADVANFSNNTRFIAAENGTSFAVYDIETQTFYRYKLNIHASSLKWMDGHRLIGNASGQFFVTDYDSTNQHTLTPSSLKSGGFFNGDYNLMFTIARSAKGASLQMVDMRTGADLPS